MDEMLIAFFYCVFRSIILALYSWYFLLCIEIVYPSKVIMFSFYFSTICIFSELFTSVNFRLPFVEEHDKELYLQDYLEEIKKVSSVKTDTNEEKLFTFTEPILVGIATKPQLKQKCMFE